MTQGIMKISHYSKQTNDTFSTSKNTHKFFTSIRELLLKGWIDSFRVTNLNRTAFIKTNTMSKDEDLKVIPVSAFDLSGSEKLMIITTGWVLDGVLDAGKVEQAFEQLVNQWPILSSRLRTNKSVSDVYVYKECVGNLP